PHANSVRESPQTTINGGMCSLRLLRECRSATELEAVVIHFQAFRRRPCGQLLAGSEEHPHDTLTRGIQCQFNAQTLCAMPTRVSGLLSHPPGSSRPSSPCPLRCLHPFWPRLPQPLMRLLGVSGQREAFGSIIDM